jgi:hypothetical protein
MGTLYWPVRSFDTGFHRLELVFGVVSVGLWAYVFNEWWGLLPAAVAAIPVGVGLSILPSVLLGALRRLPLVGDALLTWLFVLGGIALAVYALAAFEGATLAMFALAAAEIVASGIGLLRA